MLLVYDDMKKIFRELNRNNYDDNLEVGTIFFEREAVQTIKKYATIIGYAFITKDGYCNPVDIQDEKIVIFEGTYNCLPEEFKAELIPYNIHIPQKYVWSRFFFQWQFLCSCDSFKINGPFIELCSRILGNQSLIKKCCNEEINLIMPSNYKELCELAQNLKKVTGNKLINSKYDETANYIIDALLNNIHINMSKDDFINYCFSICNILNDELEENNV